VREAAEFWTSFYEQAAQVHIPTYEDYSTLNEQQSSRSKDESTRDESTQPGTVSESASESTSESAEQRYEPSIISTESSFMPGQAAFASTPATMARQHSTFISAPSTRQPITPRSHYSFASAHPERSSLWATHLSIDDSLDGLPPGMSPPVLMSPARPPRSTAELGLGKTPTRLAAERITQDLISDIQRKSGGGGMLGRQRFCQLGRIGLSGTESSMSTVPTPPSLSRYTRQFSQESQDASFSDEDSLDEVHNTAHPSAAFLMASQGLRGSSDDSFGSSNRSSDSLSGEDAVDGLGPVHPFAHGADGFEDDTFDDDIYEDDRPQEETLFGVPPAQRARGSVAKAGDEHFRLLGEDLVQDTLGIGEQLARIGRIEESPTPAPSRG